MNTDHESGHSDSNSGKKTNSSDSLEYQNKLFRFKFEDNLIRRNKQETTCKSCKITFETFLACADHHCLPFRCKVCPIAFKYDYMLNTHNVKHSAGELGDEKCNDKVAYCCRFCGSTFQEALLLVNHFSNCPKKQMKCCNMCKEQLPFSFTGKICKKCKFIHRNEGNSFKWGKKFKNTSSKIRLGLPSNGMKISSETDSVASMNDSAVSSDTSSSQSFTFSGLSPKRKVTFENSNSVLGKCAKRSASERFQQEITSESNLLDSGLKPKRKVKKGISKNGAKVMLKKINLSSYRTDSESVNSVINAEQNCLLSNGHASERVTSKPSSISSLQIIRQVSFETKKRNISNTNLNSCCKENNIKQKELQNSVLSPGSPKSFRKIVNSASKRSLASSKKNGLESTSSEKSLSTVQTVPAASNKMDVETGDMRSDTTFTSTGKQQEKNFRASELVISDSILDSSIVTVRSSAASKKIDDVGQDLNRSPKKKSDSTQSNADNNTTNFEVIFNALPDEESGILLRIPAENSVSFRCTKCNQLFKYAKRAAIHYSNCKHPRIKRARFSVSLKDVEWICLQCYYHCNDISDLIVHKRACSISCSSVSSTGANIERCIRNYSDTCINFCEKCCYACLSTVSFNKHPCKERLEHMKTCYISVRKLTPDDYENPSRFKIECQSCGKVSPDGISHIEHVDECSKICNLHKKNNSRSRVQQDRFENYTNYQVPGPSNIHETQSRTCVDMNPESSSFCFDQNRNEETSDVQENSLMGMDAKVFLSRSFIQNLCNVGNTTVVPNQSELHPNISSTDHHESLAEVNSNSDADVIVENSSLLKELCCELCRMRPCSFCVATNPAFAEYADAVEDTKPCFTCLTIVLVRHKNHTEESEENQTLMSSSAENADSSSAENANSSSAENANSSSAENADSSSVENADSSVTNNANTSTTLISSSEKNTDSTVIDNSSTPATSNTSDCPVTTESQDVIPDASSDKVSSDTSNCIDTYSKNSEFTSESNEYVTVYPKICCVRLVRKEFDVINRSLYGANIAILTYLKHMESGLEIPPPCLNRTETCSPDPDSVSLSNKTDKESDPQSPSESLKNHCNSNIEDSGEKDSCEKSSDIPNPNPGFETTLLYNKPSTYFFNCSFEKLMYDLIQYEVSEMYISFQLGSREIHVMWCFDVDIFPHIYVVKTGPQRTNARFVCGVCTNTLKMSNMIDHVARKHNTTLINVLVL